MEVGDEREEEVRSEVRDKRADPLARIRAAEAMGKVGEVVSCCVLLLLARELACAASRQNFCRFSRQNFEILEKIYI